LAQLPVGSRKVVKYFFIHLSATTSLRRLVWLAHQRWAIEQQYNSAKTNSASNAECIVTRS
jgi:hypothetical protein